MPCHSVNVVEEWYTVMSKAYELQLIDSDGKEYCTLDVQDVPHVGMVLEFGERITAIVEIDHDEHCPSAVARYENS